RGATARARSHAHRRAGSRPRRGPFAGQLTWPDLTSRRQAGQRQSSTGKLQPRMSTAGRAGWLHRLREGGVIRVAASYAVIAWLLLQIADVTFEPLGVPKWGMASLIVAAVLGFPVAVALAWFYEAGDGGVIRDTAAEGAAGAVVHGLRRYADLLIIAVLLSAVAVLLVRQSGLGGDTANPAIAVLPFKNLTA